ncbi:MAG: polyprenyl synthetase family protein, partial [Ruminiclostridium sp.]|nr:polyprenyl synthetase family protein [Ruminiclostridium sp.]
ILPFEMIAKSTSISPDAAVKFISTISHLCGTEGMIGGQQIDTEQAGNELPGDTLLMMYSLKTSALLKAVCMCGVYCAQCANEERYVRAAEEYAENLGIAFQITDDILDVTSTPEILGKQTGNDMENDKHTYVRTYGLDKARSAAAEYTAKALEALEVFDDNDFVKSLTSSLLGRKK